LKCLPTKKKKLRSQHLTVLSGWVVTFASTKPNLVKNAPLVAAVETVAVVAAVAVAITSIPLAISSTPI
jgi:hypothetical protein